MGAKYSGTHATPRLELGQAMAEFVTDNSEFIANKVFPVLPVEKKEASFAKITREGLLRRAPNIKIGSDGEYARDDFLAEDDSYKCEEYGLETRVRDSIRSLYSGDFDADMNAVKTVTRRLLQEQEIRVATAVFNTTAFTGSSLASATSWSTHGAPVFDHLGAAIEQFRGNCGMDPNTLVIGKTAFLKLLGLDDIKERVVYIREGTYDNMVAALPSLLGVEKVLVARGVYNSANEGQSATIADIWAGSLAVLARTANQGDGLMTPCLGRTFMWTQDAGSIVVAEQYREDQTRSDVFRVRQHVDEKLFETSFGYMLNLTLS